ncbi:MAG: ribulose-phosphate 3-epimerase [Planctomycetes bacterium]|nr:ribulose-phosphate 3-epimerase [Planctomycetota bacterium]
MKLPKAGTIEIAPSILSADFARLGEELSVLESAGVKIAHIDVMDGHFVPNITMGPPVVAKIRGVSKLCFDCHLMISEPAKYVESFVKAGADVITFHIEATDEPEKVIEQIHELGCGAGITLNPDTKVSAIEKVASLCDMVLVMTVHPGFSGQKFIGEAAEKIGEIRKLVGPDIRVQVDGGISVETAGLVTSLGADTLVAGNAVFSNPDRAAAIKAILEAAG